MVVPFFKQFYCCWKTTSESESYPQIPHEIRKFRKYHYSFALKNMLIFCRVFSDFLWHFLILHNYHRHTQEFLPKSKCPRFLRQKRICIDENCLILQGYLFQFSSWWPCFSHQIWWEYSSKIWIFEGSNSNNSISAYAHASNPILFVLLNTFEYFVSLITDQFKKTFSQIGICWFLLMIINIQT